VENKGAVLCPFQFNRAACVCAWQLRNFVQLQGGSITVQLKVFYMQSKMVD